MRLTGLATNMDIDNTVKQMMAGYRTKVDSVKKETTSVQWRQQMLREITTEINKLKYTYLDIKGGDKNILNLNSSNTLAVSDKIGTSASAKVVGGNALEGNYEVDVLKVAEAPRIVDKTIGKDYVATSDGSFKIDYTDEKGAKSLNIQFSKGDTTETIVNKINEELNKEENKEIKASVNVRYSEISGGLVIEGTKTGSDKEISVSKTTSEGTSSLNSIGIDAQFTITDPNGVKSQTITSKSNEYTIDGVKVSLYKEGKTSFTVKKDTDEAYNKVKAFFDDYNKLVDKIYTKYAEKKNYKYKPLTSEEKAEMKEEDIKLWEEKARQGVLSGDSDLSGMLNSLRNCFFAGVEGCDVKFGSSLGISTSSDYTKPGQITIDEKKFKESLEKDPEGVFKLLNGKSETDYSAVNTEDRKKRFNESGVFQRLSDVIMDYTRTMGMGSDKRGILIEKAGMKDEYGTFNETENPLSKKIKEKEKLVEEMLVKISKKENALYLQFSKLETSMNKMNAQMSYLSSQLGG